MANQVSRDLEQRFEDFAAELITSKKIWITPKLTSAVVALGTENGVNNFGQETTPLTFDKNGS